MTTQTETKEKRRLKRFSANLKVYDQSTDDLLGYAENIHTKGMMLMTQEKIPDKQQVEIWFGAGKEDKRQKRIFISAFKVWDSFTDDTVPRLYYSGLHFIEPDEATIHRIEKLIDEEIKKLVP